MEGHLVEDRSLGQVWMRHQDAPQSLMARERDAVDVSAVATGYPDEHAPYGVLGSNVGHDGLGKQENTHRTTRAVMLLSLRSGW